MPHQLPFRVFATIPSSYSSGQELPQIALNLCEIKLTRQLESVTMATLTATDLQGAALGAWRSFLQSHASILRALDAELVAEHGLTARDYEVLLYLAQSPDRKLAMSALAARTMLTRSGITRLVDGLVGTGLIERLSCHQDARVSYASLTNAGYKKLREASRTHIASIERLFLSNFSAEEIQQLAALLARLPGAGAGGVQCTVD
jgi:DNA-binding MarR family transcriptional regulator